MNIIPTDLIAERILSKESKVLGVINEVVINCRSTDSVFLLVDVEKWVGTDTPRVVIPYSALDITESGELSFDFPVRLLKTSEFQGDHRDLQKQNDIFFTCIVRAFEFWKTSEDYFSNSHFTDSSDQDLHSSESVA